MQIPTVRGFSLVALLAVAACGVDDSDPANYFAERLVAGVNGTIYVAPSPLGSDTNGKGTADQPYLTLAKAGSVATVGQLIKLAPGTYEETQPTKLALGVSIEGAGPSQTILRSAGVALDPGINASDPNYKRWADGTLIQLVSAAYGGASPRYGDPSLMLAATDGNQTLSGFSIDGAGKSLKAGVWVENRSNVTVHHVDIKNTKQTGAVFTRGDMYWYVELPAGKWIQNIVVHDMNFTNAGSSDGNEQEGCLKLGGIDGGNVYNITISDTQGEGIKFAHVGHLRNTKVHDSTITVSESHPQWGEWMAIELWNLSTGNEVYNINANTWLSMVNHPGLYASPAIAGANLKVRNVRIVDADGTSGKETIELAVPGVEVSDSFFQNKGFGLAIWDSGGYRVSAHNNVFFNTVVQSSWAHGGVYIDNSHGDRAYSDIAVSNNVFANYTDAVTIKTSNGGTVNDVSIRNNAFLGVTGNQLAASSGSGIAFTNNLAANSLNILGATSQSNNYQNQDPGFIGSGDPATTWYKPASSSSFVVGRGTDVGFGTDIGAFRWTSSGTTTPPPATTARLEAEDAFMSGGAARASDHAGASAGAFVAGFWGNTTASVRWSPSAQTAGTKVIQIGYSAGNGASSHLGLYVNGTRTKGLSLPATSNWETWSSIRESVELVNGDNTIEIKAESSSAACENLDYLEIIP